jgi:NlpC/P60 family putative phage cell wall peptidase
VSERIAGETAVADRVRAAALGWVGTPYRHQGSRRGVGCDCLGLVLGVWREVYGMTPEDAPAYARDWAEISGDPLLAAARRHCIEKSIPEAVAGDLLLFRWRNGLAASHMAILVDRDRIVHACEGRAVIVTRLVPQWRRRIAGTFAFPDTFSGNREE